MNQGKLFEILQSLNGHDLNRVEKFLGSPFFNEDKEVLKLFRFLSGEKVKQGSWPGEKKTMFRAVYGKVNYDDKKFRYLISGLTKQLEHFLVQKKLQQQPRIFLQLKQQALFERQCFKAFQFTSAELEKELKGGQQDAGSLLVLHDSALLGLEFASVQQSRKKAIHFDSVLDSLDSFYVARKLQLASELVNAQNVVAGTTSVRLLEEVKSLSLSPGLKDLPAVEIYRTVLNTLTHPQEEIYFEELKDLVLRHQERFPLREQKELYQYLKNYCVKQINTGNIGYATKLFEIYRLSLANTKLFRAEPLSPWEYKNIVTIGLRMKEFKWVRNFIRDYNRFLEPAQQRNAIVYNMANLHFHRREFKETLRLFREVEFTDLYYQLDVRAILLKVYIELDDEETFYYHASAFRTFLSRNRLVSDYQRKIYRNLVKYAVRFVRDGHRPKKMASLLEEIRTVRQVADIRWLEEKVGQVIQ